MIGHFSCLLRKFDDILFLVLLGISISMLTGCIPPSEVSYAEPTLVFVNHVAQETNELTQLWFRDDVYILWGNETMDASMGVGCFIGNLGNALRADGNNQLVCIKSETGEVVWKQESVKYRMLATTTLGILVTEHNEISNYNLQSGEIIWRKNFNDSSPLSLMFFGNQIQVMTWKPGNKLWVFDIDGNTLKVINDTYAFLTTPDATFTHETGVRAIRTDTNDILWDYVDTGLAQMPTVTLDKIFCRSNSKLGLAYALDRNTGKLLWQVNDIVYGSTLAHSPEKQLVYALRNNGDLLAINENTGEMHIAAKFSSAPFLLNIAGTAQAYELAYDEEYHILLVSLGDSHQLYAFKEG